VDNSELSHAAARGPAAYSQREAQAAIERGCLLTKIADPATKAQITARTARSRIDTLLLSRDVTRSISSVAAGGEFVGVLSFRRPTSRCSEEPKGRSPMTHQKSFSRTDGMERLFSNAMTRAIFKKSQPPIAHPKADMKFSLLGALLTT
jgi:hypothetical protein